MSFRSDEMVTYVEPDHEEVSRSHADKWRIFNGTNWTHGFDEKEEAIKFAKEMGGTRIAFCKLINDKVHYVSPEKVN